MAAPSAQTLQRLADDTGHQPGTLEKVLRLLDLLQEIARDRILSDRLVLKGGTALNLFQLGLDRLSVDIDLNYVGALALDAVLVSHPNPAAHVAPTVSLTLNRSRCTASRDGMSDREADPRFDIDGRTAKKNSESSASLGG